MHNASEKTKVFARSVLTALLDFPNAARAEVFTGRLSDVSGGATCLCALPEKNNLEKEVPDALRLGHPGE